MKYNKEDIKFEEISPQEFENLCYDLLVKYNFHNLVWRQGGADSGRDIEGCNNFTNPILNKEIKWFFECKRYTKGISPEELQSKIAWADAEQPQFLTFFITSYLTKDARTWLDKIHTQKSYEIVLIEGEEIKERLLNYPDIIERYFSLNRYEKMLKDIKDYQIKFNIFPSIEILQEIITNIDLEKLDLEDYSFILIGFYNQYEKNAILGKYWGEFDKQSINRVLDYLATIIINESLSSFESYKNKYDILGDSGLFNEMKWYKSEFKEESIDKCDFALYHLHLNYNEARENWKIGIYLLIIHQKVAFEIFKVEKSEIRIIRNFNPDKINDISIFADSEKNNISVDEYKKYLKSFET